MAFELDYLLIIFRFYAVPVVISSGLSDKLRPENISDVVNFLEILRSSLKNPDNVGMILRADFLPLLEECLTHEDAHIRRSAVWTLCFVTRNDPELRGHFIKYITRIVHFLEIELTDRCFQADCLKLLANFAGDSAKGRDSLLEEVSCPDSLLDLINKILHPQLLQEIAYLMRCITEHGPHSSGLALRDAVFTILNCILALDTSCDCWVIKNVCRAFLNVLRFPTSDTIQMVKANNVVRKLIWHSTHAQSDMKCTRLCFATVIQLIVILFHGDNDTCQEFIDQGALRVLSIVVEEDRSELFYHICVAIANVFACDPPQIQCAIDNMLLTEVIRQLEHGDLRIQREAGFALGSFLDGAHKEQVLQAFEQGLVPPLIQQLQSYDPETVYDTLVSLFKLMYHAIELKRDEEFLQEMIEFDIKTHIEALGNDRNETIAWLAKHFSYHFLLSN